MPIQKKYLLIIIILLVLCACGSVKIIRNHYVLHYNPVLSEPKLSLSKPLPYAIEVMDTNIMRTYDRSQMIIRHSAHRIEYSRENIWAVRVSTAVPDLINNHINKFNLFTRCQREYLNKRPDYEIVTTVNRIEMFKNDFYHAVNFSIDYYLRDATSGDMILKYPFAREIEVNKAAEMDMFAKKVSDMIENSTNGFLLETVEYFQGLEQEASGE